ncbi:hypothetical protein MNB_SV-6-1021 [hydrothermal vent metagenome]|uniref:Uncharacterized protein n=1 Tax=hydrothermal vent metagenome TaxID=652676 RepID=A0A1W1C7Q9_9ZZZZ
MSRRVDEPEADKHTFKGMVWSRSRKKQERCLRLLRFFY